jgi:hypothetical protein
MDKKNIFDLSAILEKNIQKPISTNEQPSLEIHKLKHTPVYIQSNPILYQNKQPFSQKLKMLNTSENSEKMRSTGIRTNATIDPLVYKEVQKEEWLLLPISTYVRVLYNDNTTSAGGRIVTILPHGDGTYYMNIKHQNPKNISTSSVNTDDINKLYRLINDKREQKPVLETVHEQPDIKQDIVPQPLYNTSNSQHINNTSNLQPLQSNIVVSRVSTPMPLHASNSIISNHPANNLQNLISLQNRNTLPMSNFHETHEMVLSLNHRVDTIEIQIQRIEQTLNKIVDLIKERIKL